MWQSPTPSPVEERDRGLQKVRTWTMGLVLLAASLVALIAGLAAGSFAGHTTAAASDSPSTTSPDDQSSSSDQPQSPPGGFFNLGGGGGGGHAVSGGS